jgi:CxxC motif-containing protein
MKKLLLLISLTLSLTIFSQNKLVDSVDCARTINMYKKLEIKLQNNINSQNSILKLQTGEINLLNEHLVKTKKQVKKQKIYKWTSIVSSILLGCYIIKEK